MTIPAMVGFFIWQALSFVVSVFVGKRKHNHNLAKIIPKHNHKYGN
jgi:hypothetical protein